VSGGSHSKDAAAGCSSSRPVLWALAAAGPEGAEQVIKGLTAELTHVILQLGTATIYELTPDLLSL
jgi:isopentenyl diphosphate isomerase/L-lactate dehydrogenase-like FMN-dependent dehydrogenase